MKKKGFTLIELMIVLAIIAILAVVIIPKSSIFKKNAKTAGVTTNMNTVRAYLETKTGDNAFKNVGTGTDNGAGELKTAMFNNFKGNETIINPKNNSFDDIVLAGSGGAIDSNAAVVVSTVDPGAASNPLAITDVDYPGTVIIYVGTTAYTVYGVDLDGNLLGNKYTIEK